MWDGLTVAFCRQQGAGVIIRGVRNGADLRHEYQLAAMNDALGVTTLLLPAQPGLTAISSTVLRDLRVLPAFRDTPCLGQGARVASVAGT
jgi:pantetheine-phosphate adenylyltransferase